MKIPVTKITAEWFVYYLARRSSYLPMNIFRLTIFDNPVEISVAHQSVTHNVSFRKR
jgi:hypothetical protein